MSDNKLVKTVTVLPDDKLTSQLSGIRTIEEAASWGKKQLEKYGDGQVYFVKKKERAYFYQEKLEIPHFQCNGCGCVWYTPDEVNTCCSGSGYEVLWPGDKDYEIPQIPEAVEVDLDVLEE